MPSTTAVRFTRWKAAGSKRTVPFGSASPVTFPTSTLKITVRIALSSSPTIPWWQWNWLDISSRIRQADGVTITAGRRDWSSTADSITARLRIDNQDGYFSRRNPLSPYYGLLTRNTPIWITVDPGSGEQTRFQGYVNEWPTRWTDKSGTDTTVPIVCAGAMRRLQRGGALKSPLYRTMSGTAPNDYVPYVYWPLEDESGSDRFASAISGMPSLGIASGVTAAADSTLGGSDSLPTLASGAAVDVRIPTYTNQGQFVLQWAYKLNAEPASETILAEFYASSGPVRTWRITCLPGSPAALWLYDLDSSGAVINSTGLSLDGSGAGNPAESAFFGQWAIYTLAPTQSGSNVNSWFGMTITPTRSGMAFANIDAGTLGVITGGRIFAAGGASLGHIAGYTDSRFQANFTSTDALNNVAAMNGYTGEAAHTRVARLCREENIPVYTVAAGSVAMGVQPNTSFVTALRECETADLGFLYEREFGVAYQASSERSNAPIAMALDFAQQHIQETPEPADDDQKVANRVKASRSGGSFAVVQDATSVASDLVYEQPVTVNVQTDALLYSEAGARLRRGTVDEDRWPQITIKLHATPGLIPSWTAMQLGYRMTIANPPAQLAPFTIDTVLEGYTERIDLVRWEVDLYTTPYSVNETFVVETGSGNRSRLSLRGSLIGAGGLPSGATSMLVTTTGRPWITDASFPALFPFVVVAGGEPLTVTGISSATSPQTFTVTRTLAKDHSAGETVTLYKPPAFALRGNG